MAGTVSNIRIEPCNVFWGADAAQVQTITTTADVASSLNNKYFFIYTALNAIKYHVWFNVAAAGVDPAPAGSTAVAVAIAANADANTVASAVQAAVDALAGFTATVSGAVVTVTAVSNGYASSAHDGAAASVTNFSFQVTTVGDLEEDAGFVDGDIELSPEEDVVDIVAHQTGTDVLGGIRTGKRITATFTFKETSRARILKIISQQGSSYLPIGSSATEVAGWGTHKNFLQTNVDAKKLRFHPVSLGTADKSRDFTIHKFYTQWDSLVFSGENIFNLPLTGTVYPDFTKHERVRYYAYGDSSQSLVP